MNSRALILATLMAIAKKNGGIANLAKKTKLSRESLYKTLSGNGNPKLETLIKITNTLGYDLELKWRG